MNNAENNSHIILHLSLINGIGPAAIERICTVVPTDQLHELYHWSAVDLQKNIGLTEAQAARIKQGLTDKLLLEKELSLIEKHSIQLITIFDVAYPDTLRSVYLPPPILYCKGQLPVGNALAIVGSRNANAYAHAVLEQFIPTLCKNRWIIVSGGAIGVDTIAHTLTVQSGGSTIVVLGSGLLDIYPPRNKRLFEQIVENNGALLSSFPLTTAALAGNFPARNRIIAGLSRGCLVVQAAAKSGAKITAHYALEQGRELFVIPGRITDELSVGCHQLLQQGAHLVTTAQDILSIFGQYLTDQINDTHKQKDLASLSAVIPEAEQANSLQERLLQLCTKPMMIDDLVDHSGESVLAIQEALFALQLEGKISQQFSGLWLAV